jgi:hypothetical protein
MHFSGFVPHRNEILAVTMITIAVLQGECHAAKKSVTLLCACVLNSATLTYQHCLSCALQAQHKCQLCQEQQKKLAIKKASTKRKAIVDEMQSLKVKKQLLQTDVGSLKNCADPFAGKNLEFS